MEFTIPIDPSNYNFVDFKNLLSNYLINLVLYCTVLFFALSVFLLLLDVLTLALAICTSCLWLNFFIKKQKQKKDHSNNSNMIINPNSTEYNN